MTFDLFPSSPLDLEAECAKLPDITRSRHHGNPESEAANERVHGTKEDTRLRILALVREAGERGMTSKEIAAALGKQLNTISGRLSEMRAPEDGRLVAAGETRDGAAVLKEGGK